jgi:large subunit ribosomal protein L22
MADENDKQAASDAEEKKPRRRRSRRRKPDEAAAETEATPETEETGGPEASAAETAEEPEAAGEPEPEAEPEEDADEADATAEAEDDAEDDADEKAPARRRGSPETSATAAKKPAPRRDGDGAVVVAARARYVRSAPRKARLVMEHIRGKPVEQARGILNHVPRSVSTDILKLLNSAVANAESSYELAVDELRVERAWVDEGPTIKRYRPRALGRATRINRRTSHMTIELTVSEPADAGSRRDSKGRRKSAKRKEKE